MKRRTQIMLYHLLPVAFWLLAVGGSIVPLWFVPNYAWTFIPATLVWLSMVLLNRIPPHSEAVEPSFKIAVLLALASCWLPTVVFAVVPVWLYLIYRRLFNLRVFLATVIGLALVAIWAWVLYWIPATQAISPVNIWSQFFATENAWGWIPTGAVIFAYQASTIARRNLRVR